MLRSAISLIFLLLLTIVASAETVIGVVTDGPEARALIPMDALQAEIRALTAEEFDIRFPSEKQLDGGWTREGTRAALEQLLSDPDVDIILCAGIAASNEAAQIPVLAKPVIATIVADHKLQKFPKANLSSGKKNFVYLTNFRNIDDDLRLFKKAVGFKKLALLADNQTLRSIQALSAEKLKQLSSAIDSPITPVLVGDSVAEVLAAIPADVDAVYITPLLRFDDQAMRDLAQGLIDRKLPSFSLFGVSEIETGVLMAAGGRPEDIIRVTRRIALNIQRILLGEEPGDLPMALQGSSRLAINMRTAAAIGYSPSFTILGDSEQFYLQETDEGDPVTLLAAMGQAIEANLGLRVSAYDPLLAAEDARLARSSLVPRLDIDAGWAKVNDERAFSGFQAEASVDASAQFRQLIYSDDAWASWQIARHLESAAGEEYGIAILDTLKAAGQNYMNLLRAIALEDVRRSNLEVTRANLSLARVRESIGFSGRADVLRWQSRLALDQRDLLAAESQKHQAENVLNQVLNRSQSSRIKPLESSVQSTLAQFSEPRFTVLIDNEKVWLAFQDYIVIKGLEDAPELNMADSLIAAGERQVTASTRRFWIPELELVASGSENISRSGAGSENIVGGFLEWSDQSWAVGVQARLPIFSGGALRANLDKSRYALKQQRQTKEAIAQQIETRIRIAMHRAGSSFAAIDLSMAAATASSENLGIVTDGYSKGALSVTDLIDAQNAALAADLAAAEARYVYLIELMEVLRAAGNFQLILDPLFLSAWYSDVEAFFIERGIFIRTDAETVVPESTHEH